MNTETLYDELKALQNKAFDLSKQDRQFIRDASKELSIEFSPRSKCLDCYKDQIIILLIELKKRNEASNDSLIIDDGVCRYEMVNNKSIKWAGFYINNITITNELAEKFKDNVRDWESFIKLK